MSNNKNLPKEKRGTQSNHLLIWSFITIIVVLLSMIPGLSFLLIITAVTAMVISAYHGNKPAITLAIVLVLFGLATNNFENMVIFLLIFYVPGIVMGFFVRNKRAAVDVMFYGLFSMMLTTILFVFVSQAFFEIHLFQLLVNQAKDVIVEQQAMLQEMIGEQADIEALQLIDLHLLQSLIPSNIIMIFMILSGVSFLIGQPFLPKEYQIRFPFRMSYFNLPGNISFGVILIFLLYYLFSSFVSSAYSQLVFINLVRIMIILFFFQGMGVALFFLQKRKVPIFLQAILVGLTFLLGPINTALSIVGFLDSMFHFRIPKRV